MSDKAQDIQKEIEELRATATQQIKNNRSGSSTNYKAATKTRRDIARKLTELNKSKQEGEKE